MPRVPWTVLHQRLQRDWRQGEHITIVGPTRSGKTHIALELVELRSFVLVLACKRRDPLVEDLQAHDYHVTGDLDELIWTAEHGRPARPTRPKVVYWPRFPERMDDDQKERAQARLMKEAMAWADRTGNWCVLVDETMWMSEQLRLDRSLNRLWFQGRTQGLSVVALVQRPSRVPRLAFSSPDYFFLGKTGDKQDIERYRDINSTIPRELLENAVADLDFEGHEFLFVDTHTNELARVIAPAR